MLGIRRYLLTTPRTFRILKTLKFTQPFQRPKGARFGLLPFRSPLLREYVSRPNYSRISPNIFRITILFGSNSIYSKKIREKHFFLFLRLLRCFTSAGTLSDISKSECFDLSSKRVSPFGNPRIKGCYAPPRGLSQLRHVLHRLLNPWGIHHTPLVTSHQRNLHSLLNC